MFHAKSTLSCSVLSCPVRCQCPGGVRVHGCPLWHEDRKPRAEWVNLLLWSQACGERVSDQTLSRYVSEQGHDSLQQFLQQLWTAVNDDTKIYKCLTHGYSVAYYLKLTLSNHCIMLTRQRYIIVMTGRVKIHCMCKGSLESAEFLHVFICNAIVFLSYSVWNSVGIFSITFGSRPGNTIEWFHSLISWELFTTISLEKMWLCNSSVHAV